MATIYFDKAGKVAGINQANVGLPGTTQMGVPEGGAGVDFDQSTNPLLWAALSHEPQRITLGKDGKSILLDGNPFPVNPDRPEEQARRLMGTLATKAGKQPLTLPELTQLVLALVARMQAATGEPVTALALPAEVDTPAPSPKKVTRKRS